MEDSAYPKIVFECLLDQIEKLQGENHRLLYGDAEEGLDNGLVVDEHGMLSYFYNIFISVSPALLYTVLAILHELRPLLLKCLFLCRGHC